MTGKALRMTVINTRTEFLMISNFLDGLVARFCEGESFLRHADDRREVLPRRREAGFDPQSLLEMRLRFAELLLLQQHFTKAVVRYVLLGIQSQCRVQLVFCAVQISG